MIQILSTVFPEVKRMKSSTQLKKAKISINPGLLDCNSIINAVQFRARVNTVTFPCLLAGTTICQILPLIAHTSGSVANATGEGGGKGGGVGDLRTQTIVISKNKLLQQVLIEFIEMNV